MTTRIELSSKMVAMCLPTHMTGKGRFWVYQKRMEDGRAAILLDKRTWGYTADVAEAVRLAENDRAAGAIFNVGESGGLDMQSWIQELAAVVGWCGEPSAQPQS